jgi:hypothetical protein
VFRARRGALSRACRAAQVPFYVYTTTSAKADAFQGQLAGLGQPSDAVAVTQALNACGLVCQGVLLNAPPTVAAYLTLTIAVPPASAADSAAIVAALSRTTPFVLAMRSAGLPSTAAVTITSAPVYSAAPAPPPPRVVVVAAARAPVAAGGARGAAGGARVAIALAAAAAAAAAALG